MESENGKKVASATNDSVDNEGGARPAWNFRLEWHLKYLLNSLDKKELVKLHLKLAMKFPQVAEEIRAAARADPVHRKLHVYGFGDETTSETLVHAYSSYGEVEQGRVVVDEATGKSRHFGFVIFKNIESVPKALEREGTMLDGLQAFHQPAVTGFNVEVAAAYVDMRRPHISDIFPFL